MEHTIDLIHGASQTFGVSEVGFNKIGVKTPD
jgi:hypothetical protein